MTIFTVGYEGLSLVEFMSLLTENDIETIVDVREMPLSRKPGFSKKALGAALNLSGRKYVHIPALGCPKPIRNRYREESNWERYSDGFLQYLASQEVAVAGLSSLVATTNCALLCFEADYNFCHRSMVANAVKHQTHARVQHLHARDVRTESYPEMNRLAFA